MPISTVLQLLFQVTATRQQDFFLPESGFWGNYRSLGKIVLGYKLEWNVPGESTKDLCLLTSSPLHFSQTNPNPCKTATLRVLTSGGGATLRKEAGGGHLSTRRRGDQVTFQCPSSPHGPQFFGSTSLGIAVGGSVWIWRLWSHPERTRPCRSQRRGSLAGTSPPSSNSPTQSSLGTQGCSDSYDVITAQVSEA